VTVDVAFPFARESGYTLIEVDDLFLKSHMIIVLQPIHLK
jgi:hypothetical protein